MNRSALLLGTLLLPARTAPQGAALTAAPAFVERSWRTSEGLPHNVVWAVRPTRDGYLWVGTERGLARFDGVTFTAMDRDDAPELVGRTVFALFEDRAGALWVGTDGAGVLRRQAGRFERVGADIVGRVVRAVWQDQSGTVWVGSEKGLHSFDARGVAALVVPPAQLGNSPVASLGGEPGDGGTVWIATLESGVYALRGGTLTRFSRAEGLSTNSVRAIAVDSGGTVWVSSWNGGLDRLTRDGVIRAYPVPARGGRGLRAILAGRDGTIWAGGMNSVIRYPTSGLAAVVPPYQEEAPGRRIIALAEDLEGNVWAGTYNAGLVRLQRDVVDVMDTRHGLASANVRSVLEDPDGTLWVGTEGGLHRIRDGGVDLFTTEHGLLANGVRALYRDSSGVLWVGGTRGLNRFDGRRFTGITAPHIENAAVQSLHLAADGTMWMGTEGAGLNVYRDGVVRRVEHPLVVRSNVRRLLPATDGTLWIATEEYGLLRHRNGTFEPVGGAALRSGVRELVMDSSGALWVGTVRDGVARVRGDSVLPLGAASGFVDNQAWRILDDSLGRLWMSSDHGMSSVAKADVERVVTGRASTAASAWYGGPREYNGNSQPSGWRSRDGRLLFPSQSGIVVIDPRRPAATAPRPQLHVEQIVAGERTHLPATTGVRLAAPERDFRVDYASPSLGSPEQLRFRYRLAGYDRAWQEAGTRRAAFYTGIPAGAYTFEVEAYHVAGAWQPVRQAMRVVVAPYARETGWFAALVVMAAVAALALAYGWRVRRLRIRTRELAELVEERTGELRERERQLAEQNAQLGRQAEQLAALDDAKSRFFANVSHEFRTPLTLILGPLRDLAEGRHGALPPMLRRQHGLMMRNAQRLMRLVNQVLDLARLEGGTLILTTGRRDLVELSRAAVRAFAPLAERRGIALKFRAESARLPVEVDAEQFEKVLLNLLSNAFKFTEPGGEVEVTVREANGSAELVVRDTGIGIDAEKLPHIFERFYQADSSATRRHEGTGIGLSLVHELVELHGGTIDVESQPGVGSTFRVRLPLAASGAEADGAMAPRTADGPLTFLAAEPHHDGHDGGAQEAAETDRPDETDRTTVLVVDDHADIRDYVRSVLEPDYRVLEAADGQFGLECAREALPDLVIADVMMPRLDGLGLARALRDDPTTDCIPTILLTARADAEAEVEGLVSGADDYITKPFHAGVLRARVNGLIASRRWLRERFQQAGPPPAEPPVPAVERSGFELQLRSVIEANLADPDFNPEALAAGAGMSYHQMYRRLASELDSTPSKFIRFVRVERAAELLKNEAGSVTEVAYSVGFNSLSHFHRSFRERFGTSPTTALRLPG